MSSRDRSDALTVVLFLLVLAAYGLMRRHGILLP